MAKIVNLVSKDTLIANLQISGTERIFVDKNWQIIVDMAAVVIPHIGRKTIFESSASRSNKIISYISIIESNFREKILDGSLQICGDGPYLYEKCRLFAGLLTRRI